MLKKILKQIFSLVRFFVTFVILAIVAIILVQRISNNTKTVLGFRIFNVVTESMVPKYNVGDVLLVKAKEAKTIQVGEDIAYQGMERDYANKVITHQVIKIEANENGELIYHTKGIANEDEDPTIKGNQIYGVVLTKLQLMSWVNGIINNMYGMYFLIVIPLAIIFFTEMKGIKKDFEEKKDGSDENEEDDDESEDNEKSVRSKEKNKSTNEEKNIDKKIQKRKEKRAKRRKRYE